MESCCNLLIWQRRRLHILAMSTNQAPILTCCMPTHARLVLGVAINHARLLNYSPIAYCACMAIFWRKILGYCRTFNRDVADLTLFGCSLSVFRPPTRCAANSQSPRVVGNYYWACYMQRCDEMAGDRLTLCKQELLEAIARLMSISSNFLL